MQLPKVQFVFVRNWRDVFKNKKVWFGLAVLFLALGVVLWRSSRVALAANLEKIGGYVKSQLSLGEVTEVDQGAKLRQEGESMAARMESLEEINKQLEKGLLDLQKQISQDRQTVVAMREQITSAVAGVAKSNDILTKEQESWLATLKKVEARVGVAGSSEVATVSGVTSAGVSATETPLSVADNSSAPNTTSGKININTATASQLDSLSGIGPSIAQKIIAYREEKGAFRSIEDIVKVSGIGPALLEKIRDQIEV